MKNLIRSVSLIGVLFIVFINPAFAAGPDESGYSPEMQAKVDQMKKELQKYTDEKATIGKNIETFDTLDFIIFSNQEWTRLHQSHSKDVKVNWPDGHYTNGIERHIEDLKALFVMHRYGHQRTSDKTRVRRLHRRNRHHDRNIHQAHADWGRNSFNPRGKKYSIPMCTIGHWKDGVMIEEWRRGIMRPT